MHLPFKKHEPNTNQNGKKNGMLKILKVIFVKKQAFECNYKNTRSGATNDCKKIICFFFCSLLVLQTMSWPAPAETFEPVLCRTFDCIQSNRNAQASVDGILSAYVPSKSGKGAGHMFWNWQLSLSDGVAIPLISPTLSDEKIRSFDGKPVRVSCRIYEGIIIGSADGQNAVGYRLDVDAIGLMPVSP